MPQRFQRSKQPAVPAPVGEACRRTAAELLAAAREHAERRERREAERQARERERREREQAAAREKRLEEMAGREEELWRRVESLVEAKKALEYEAAVQTLVDLRELAARGGDTTEFTRRLQELPERHPGKRAFISRLEQAGLRGGSSPGSEGKL